MLKEKFIRQISDAQMAGARVASAEVHPETGIALLIECFQPDPSKPPPPPHELPKDLQFFGVPLAGNERVPRGEIWLTSTRG